MVRSSLLTLAAGAAAGAHASVTLCGQFGDYETKDYTYNNNAWDPNDSGSSCTTITNGTGTFDPWYAVWTWTSQPPEVHAYPFVQINNPALPLMISKVGSLSMSSSWTYSNATGASASSASGTNKDAAAAPAATPLQANVAFDMFADMNATTSQTPQKQTVEIMVWVAAWGNYAKPVGYSAGVKGTITIPQGTFNLYIGNNGRGQEVYTFFATTELQSFKDLDIAPLLQHLVTEKLVSGELYLGTVQFGTEAYYSTSPVNFSMSSFEGVLHKASKKKSTKHSDDLLE